MVARPTTPYRSANAGELSPDAKGRVDIKQYYSAGLAYKNIEPVPQSGFRQMGGSWRKGTIPSGARPRYVSLMLDDGTALSGFFTAGRVDFFTPDGHVATVSLPTVQQYMLADLDFYAEGKTIGVFHPDLVSLRLFLNSGMADWQVSNWPYDPVPKADLGGIYAKTDDVWEVFIRWTESPQIYMTITINGETTPAVPLRDAAGNPVAVNGAVEWDAFAVELQDAINDLPSIGGGVEAWVSATPANDAKALRFYFGGDLSGQEFQFSAMIVNTAQASSLPYHVQIGETQQENVFSASRGWPGSASLLQDRLGYVRIKAAKGAIALSQIGEYFNLNTDGQGDNAARLDRLRSQTSETVLYLKESQYFLVFTDRGVYFVNNRTIERNTPLNFILASETGIADNCRPFDLEGVDYYIGRDESDIVDHSGHQMLSIVYDDVSTKYNAEAESLLASHLVSGVIRSVRQKKSGDLDAAKGWLLRRDGRLIAAQLIRNQEIIGFCEWIAAHGGRVREIGVDGRNRLWLAIERGNEMVVELYDMTIFLQDAINVTPDLAGNISGLSAYEGQIVHVVADGYELPDGYLVSNGKISLGDAYASAIVGRWQAPRWESMPQVYVTPNDDVIIRPGRIHTAHINIMDTTSIAVGANGQKPKDITLLTTDDAVDAPMPAKTQLITVTGENLPGFMEGTTLVVTQTRPGRLRVRDLAMGAKL